MQTQRFTRLSGMALAVMLTLLIGSVRADDSQLEGTWDVTVTFLECSSQCPCPPSPSPGEAPTAPGLHMYLKNGSFLDAGGGSLLRGPAPGSWEVIGPHEFEAHYKFYLFNSDGTRRGSEVVTSHIQLTRPDAFEANATFDFFDPAGHRTSPEDGCTIKYTARRFE
jgi:hypothetical protein